MKILINRFRSVCLRVLSGALVVTFSLFHQTDAQAMEIQQVKSPGGIKAWLVEEHSLPLVAIRFAFDGGASQDPSGKAGVANFLTTMLDEGAGDLNSQAFQERIEDLAVKLSFSTTRDVFGGSFQSLSKNLDAGIELLTMALTKPRFDQDALDRMRQQIAAGIVANSNNPQKVAAREWFRLAFNGHPYARAIRGTVETVKLISSDDLRNYHKSVLARDKLKVSVVGDIDAKQLGVLLDKVFGNLPKTSNLLKIAHATPPIGPRQKIIEMKVPQAVAQFGHRAFKRTDKDFIASFVLNYIIGGGGFNSRLMEEVREKRGLAYSVYCYISPYQHASVFMGGVATKNEGIAESLAVITGVFKKMAIEGPSDEELKNAKRYLTGSYPLRFDTNSKIASQLLWIQVEKLGVKYIEERNKMIEAVTMGNIKVVAKRLLKADGLIVTIVGQPTNMDVKG